jgi:hypothetical protein
MEKEGLQAAIDFTKFLLTLAGGAIAFIIQPTYFSGKSFSENTVHPCVVSSYCVRCQWIAGIFRW